MRVVTIYLVSVSDHRLKVTVVSEHGERTYRMAPRQRLRDRWFAGTKVLVVYDLDTGRVLSHRVITIDGSVSILVGGEHSEAAEVAPATEEDELAAAV